MVMHVFNYILIIVCPFSYVYIDMYICISTLVLGSIVIFFYNHPTDFQKMLAAKTKIEK
jgi:hypothetical protein